MASSSSVTPQSSGNSAAPSATAPQTPPPAAPAAASAPTSIQDMLGKIDPAMKSLLQRVRAHRESLTTLRAVNGVDGNGRAYVWAMNHPQRLAYFEGMGYKIVKSALDKDGKPLPGQPQTRWMQADGRHLSGDLILMDIDVDMHKLIRFEAQYRALERFDTGEKTFEQLANAEGFATVRPKEG